MMQKASSPGGFADKPGKFGDPHGPVVGKGKVMGPVRSPAGELGTDYGSSQNTKALHGMHSESGNPSSKTGY